MVKLKGPVMSINASGSLGDVITYSNRGPTSYAKIHSIATNVPDLERDNRREAFRIIKDWWNAYAWHSKIAWTEKCVIYKMTGFNYAIKRALEQYIIQLGPTVTPVSLVVAQRPPYDLYTWT